VFDFRYNKHVSDKLLRAGFFTAKNKTLIIDMCDCLGVDLSDIKAGRKCVDTNTF
jgi:hypothetical protein